MEIDIIKLFGKYDIRVDLSKRTLIFNGINGVGKSTTLKILDCIFKKDFVKLTKYKFEKIIFKDNGNDKNIEIRYIELIPAYSEWKTILPQNYDIENDEWEQENDDYSAERDYIEPYDYEDVLRPEFMEELFTDDEIVDDYDDNYYSNEYDDRYEYDDDDWDDDYYFDNIDYPEPPIDKNEDYFNSDPYAFINKVELLSMKFDDAKVDLDKEKLDSFLSEHIKKIENGIKYYYRNDESFKWWHQEEGKEIYELFDPQEFAENLEVISTLIKQIAPVESFWINLANDYDIIYDGSTLVSLNNKLCYDSKWFSEADKSNEKPRIDFSKLLLKNSLKKKQAKEILNCDSNYETLLSSIDTITYDYNLKEKINEMFIYMKPLWTSENKSNYKTYARLMNGNEWKKMFSTYNKYRKLLLPDSTEKLRQLNQLFEKYFVDKRIIATPTRLIISTGEPLISDLKMEELSAGEQKLIVLFVIATFFDDAILLIDEPETSLSVMWQRGLIDDLEKISKCKNMIICTQSPFISDGHDFECLPQPPIEYFCDDSNMGDGYVY